MHVIKQISAGVIARGMTPAELYACIVYAIQTRPSFNVRALGCDPAAIERYAIAGYNNLIAQGAFMIDDDGYPSITMNAPDIVNFVSALRATKSVLVMMVSSGKKSFPMYYFHSDISWAFVWRNNREEWVVVAGVLAANPPENTWYRLVRKTLDTKATAKVGFKLSWFTPEGESLYHTVISAERGHDFTEPEPESSIIRGVQSTWPAVYMGSLQLMDRMEFLLEVS